MAQVIMMCGRICAGKSTLAEMLRKEYRGALLSVDEITLALLGREPGYQLDSFVEKLEEYLYMKSLQLIECGINVILDWGFWTREERDHARSFYGGKNIPFSFRYIDISDAEWQKRIEQRNADILAGKTEAYYVDKGLAEKFAAIFVPPGEDERDIIFIDSEEQRR